MTPKPYTPARLVLQGTVGGGGVAEQNRKFHMTNTHAEMVLDYSIDGTVVAAEFGKFITPSTEELYADE